MLPIVPPPPLDHNASQRERELHAEAMEDYHAALEATEDAMAWTMALFFVGVAVMGALMAWAVIEAFGAMTLLGVLAGIGLYLVAVNQVKRWI